MVSKGHLVTFLLMVVAVALVAAKGKECGDNPMKQVLLVAKRTGRSLDHVLMVLRDIDTPAYETLARRFRMYAACVGLVDTGYFRKRAAPAGGSDEVVSEASFRQHSASGLPAAHRQLQIVGSKDWQRLVPDYDAGSEPSGSERVRLSDAAQLMDDAADISRSVLALYVKGKQIMEEEHAAERHLLSGDESLPGRLTNRYEPVDYQQDDVAY